MNSSFVDRLVQRVEREIFRSYRKRHTTHFQGEKLIASGPGDSAAVREAIHYGNHQIRSYNALGGQLLQLVQFAIDDRASQVRPQDDWLGAIEEALRIRSQRKQSLFQGLDPTLQAMERRMSDLMHGPKGIEATRRRIAELRHS